MSAKPTSQSDATQPPTPGPPCVATSDVAARLDRIEDGMRDIKTALIGNAKLGHRGLVTRVESIEETVAAVAPRAEATAKRLDAIEPMVEQHDRKFLVWGAIATACGAALATAKDFFLK